MAKRENKVENMIKNHKKECKSIEKKYDNSNIKNEINDIDIKLKRSDLHIKRLEEQLEEVVTNEPNNKDLIKEYNKQINDAEKDEERQELLSDKQKLIVEMKRNEKEGKAKIEQETREQDDKLRKELTIESKDIEKDIEKLELNMKLTLHEMSEFKYEYEEGTRIPTNGSKYKELDDKYKEQTDELSDLKKAKSLCESKLKEFKDKDMKEAARIQKAINNDIQQPAQQQPAQQQPAQQQPAQQQPAQQQPAQQQPSQSRPSTNSNNQIKSSVENIRISASDNKAYVLIKNVEEVGDNKSAVELNTVEINVESAIENRKDIFKKLDINERLKDEEIRGIKGFVLKRKLNPVILDAIKHDDLLVDEYIQAVIDKRELPFKYEADLTDSNLSEKSHKIMNRIALKEQKIAGNEIKGTEKINIFKRVFRRNNNKNVLESKETPKSLPEATNKKLSTVLKQQNERYSEAYKALNQEQKESLKNMSISEIQKMPEVANYSIASWLKEQYGTDKSKLQNAPNQQQINEQKPEEQESEEEITL